MLNAAIPNAEIARTNVKTSRKIIYSSAIDYAGKNSLPKANPTIKIPTTMTNQCQTFILPPVSDRLPSPAREPGQNISL